MKPALSKKISSIIFIANLTIAITWLYHGIIPKLMYMETGELSMVIDSGMFRGNEVAVVYIVGIAEVIFGLLILFFGRKNILHWLNVFGLLALAIGATFAKPDIYSYPFNPATTEFGIIGLSIIVLLLNNYFPGINKKQNPQRENVHL